MSKICPSCGNELNDNDLFCEACGYVCEDAAASGPATGDKTGIAGMAPLQPLAQKAAPESTPLQPLKPVVADKLQPVQPAPDNEMKPLQAVKPEPEIRKGQGSTPAKDTQQSIDVSQLKAVNMAGVQEETSKVNENVGTSMLREVLSTEGRASRKEFLIKGVLSLFLIMILTGVVEALHSSILAFVLMIVIIAWMVLYITLSIRRLHDLGKSGMWAILHLTGLLVFYLAIAQGDAGPNEYGDPPVQ